MSLSVWCEKKNCYVLGPMKKEIINAFHPDYVKTHEPNFMKEFRTHEANRQSSEALSKHVEKVRKVKPSHGTLFGISKKVEPAHMMRPKQMMLSPREFHIYQRAGVKK